jgi:3-oxoacyl-[acyl-carrier protein] reductase
MFHHKLLRGAILTKLSGLTSIVTGAATGLGKAIAEELAHAGSDLAVLDIDIRRARVVADELAAFGVTARAYEMDVSRSEDVDRSFEAVISDFGRLDVVVNNAGVSLVGPHIVETTDADWHKAIAVMQTGVFYCMRAAARHMLPQKSGSVINISSIRGYSANPGRISYCAAKAAVIMMTRVAAGEWAPFGVRANSIAPGMQQTEMWEEEVRRGVWDENQLLQMLPAGRLGHPSEVGRLAVFLAGPDSSYVNGACVSIDGGLTSVPAEGTIRRPSDGTTAKSNHFAVQVESTHDF